MVEKQEPEQQIIERLPYIQMLCRRIDEISQAISRNETGEEQLDNLISDVPIEWIENMKPQLLDIGKDATEKENQFWIQFNTNQITVNNRNYLITQTRRSAVRQTKTLIISMLNKKNLLFMSKTNPEQGGISLEEIENE